jgi:hypothetical protein
MRDVTAFGVGGLACLVGGVALWGGFGALDWGWLSRLLPLTLVGIGIAMLVLSRTRN